MREQDPRVPAEVEEYLVGLIAGAGQLGGAFGGAIGGGRVGSSGGARGGARGAARTARVLKTVVHEREGVIQSSSQDVMARVAAALPRARQLGAAADLVRLAVPLGRTGLQQVVVDLELGPAAGSPARVTTSVRLRAYAKEGFLSRKPTATVAGQVWEAITSAEARDGPAVPPASAGPPAS